MTVLFKEGMFYSKQETVQATPGLLLTRTVHPAFETIPYHCHQSSYLSFIVQGDYFETGTDFSDRLKPGDAIFHPSNESHANRIGSTGATLLNFEMAETFWQDRELNEFVPTTRVTYSDPRFLGYAKELAEHLVNQERLSVLGLEGLSLSILNLFIELHNRRHLVSETLAAVDVFIHTHFNLPLTSAEIARKFEMKPDQLSRKIKQYFGESLNERITRIRLNEAVRLLLHTETVLSDIGTDVGFFDQSHFTRIFKKGKGVTPGQYRRLYQSKG